MWFSSEAGEKRKEERKEGRKEERKNRTWKSWNKKEEEKKWIIRGYWKCHEMERNVDGERREWGIRFLSLLFSFSPFLPPSLFPSPTCWPLTLPTPANNWILIFNYLPVWTFAFKLHTNFSSHQLLIVVMMMTMMMIIVMIIETMIMMIIINRLINLT